MVYTKLRIKFSRTGMLRFISHLDLCRSIRTAFRRAKLPIRYSEGFNPHPRMTFTLPLPLGAQSECEYMDIFLPEGSDIGGVCEAMNRVCPPELRFITAYVPATSLSDPALSLYEFTFEGIDEEQARGVLAQPPHIIKTNKKGVKKEIDPAPMIRSATVESTRGGVKVCATLDCAEGSYFNPDQFAQLFGARDYSILRKALYLADGREFK